MPKWFIAMKVISGARHSDATTIRLDRRSPRNTNSTTTTSATPSSSTFVTVQRAESTSSVRS